MSHLICSDHKRRIMFTKNATYHRSDNSVCTSKKVQTKKATGDFNIFTVRALAQNGRN